ncbi:metallophosphoesterase [Myxococcota bacterium]|nr:metallophosphoesterase [Myxococcota bacterium]
MPEGARIDGPVRRVETLVVSDLHLTDAEPVDPKRPYWKVHKQRAFFVDDDFAALLAYAEARATPGVELELVLDGDVFDFDAVTALPDAPREPIGWLARLRGLSSEEWMSVFKIERIIADHGPWFEALAGWLRAGHRAVFIVGNHDLELHWPAVQERIRTRLALAPDADARLVFSSWFYVSGGDTFVSHGHQYDHYCTTPSPIDPLVLVGGRPRVRIPFGDLANRYMLNGMGYFNPHATKNFIMSAREYARFFLRYMVRTQPLLLWTWFWSAAVTLAVTLTEHWRPAMRDPLLVEEKVAAIAERAQVTPSMVRRIAAVDVPSACTSPWQIIRELWLDRGLFFLAMVYVAFQLVLTVNFVWPISPWWTLVPLALLFPGFLVYSFRVRPAVFVEPLLTPERADVLHRITGARNVVFGHTHEPELRDLGPVRYANIGFWSPAFTTPEATTRIGTQSFVWIRPTEASARTLELWEWPPGAREPRPLAPA